MNKPNNEANNESNNGTKHESTNEPKSEAKNEPTNESKNEPKKGPIIGMQMYSVRQIAEYDLVKTLEEIANIGYQAVEWTGYYTYSAQQIRRNVKRLNLVIPSVHVPLRIYDEEKIIEDFEKSAEYAAEVGAKYVVIPWLPISEKFKESEMQYLIHLIGTCISVAKKNGLQLVLHNYSREFKKINGEFILEQLIGPFGKDQLQLELDLGSVYISGLDPFQIYRDYEERSPLIHLRDVTYGRKDCNLGEGKIDYAGQLHRLPHLEEKILYIDQQFDNDHELEHARHNYQFVKEQLEKRQVPLQEQFRS